MDFGVGLGSFGAVPGRYPGGVLYSIAECLSAFLGRQSCGVLCSSDDCPRVISD